MEPNAVPQTTPNELARDVLEGAEAIAEFLFGSREFRRRVYYLSSRSRLPVYRLGAMLYARKSVLLKFISGQEDAVLLPVAESEGEGFNGLSLERRLS